jgi:hypothetical protein
MIGALPPDPDGNSLRIQPAPADDDCPMIGSDFVV